jgi:hypothetical protein
MVVTIHKHNPIYMFIASSLNGISANEFRKLGSIEQVHTNRIEKISDS